MHGAKAHRGHPDPGDAVGPADLEPPRRDALIGIGACGDQYSEWTGEATCRRTPPPPDSTNRATARRRWPAAPGTARLSASTTDMNAAAATHWPVSGPSSPARSRIRCRATRCTSGSVVEDLGLHVGQQVGHGRVREHRLRLADPRRQHAKPRGGGAFHARQPQVVLPMPASPAITRPDGRRRSQTRRTPRASPTPSSGSARTSAHGPSSQPVRA